MKSRLFRVGTRGSELALAQTRWVISSLERSWPGVRFEIVPIKTQGDRILDVSLSKIGGKGLFVKEIEMALMAGEVDLAVHSMKDVPTEVPQGLCITAVTVREDPRDVLISADGCGLEGLPRGAVLGTSSLRRAAQLRNYRPDLQVVPIRGNVDTRLKKLRTQKLDAVVMAAAGLLRLNLSGVISEPIPPEICLPAVGQGALGIETRCDDADARHLAGVLDDPPTARAVACERAYLEALQGGCQVPLGAYCRAEGELLRLEGMVADPDGKRLLRDAESGSHAEAEEVGRRLAERLLSMGADQILSGVRRGEAHAGR